MASPEAFQAVDGGGTDVNVSVCIGAVPVSMIDPVSTLPEGQYLQGNPSFHGVILQRKCLRFIPDTSRYLQVWFNQTSTGEVFCGVAE